jgi:pyrroloquinoline quinone (PQQ) biosynthesis protein C
MKSQKLTQIETAWFEEVKRFNESPAIKRMIAGELTIAHYQALLREIYFYARESPQFFSAIPIHLRGRQREFTKKMLQHAASEAGHDTLALADLKTLGVNIETIPFERPLPETSALIGFSFYLIQYLNPVSYLGFVFFLEYLSTHFVGQYAKGLLSAGVPPAAMTFLGEHVEADVEHNRLMADYVEHLLITERDVEDMIYAMRVTSNLYAKVYEAAFRSVDEGVIYDYGANRAELEAAQNDLKQRLAA